MGKINLNQREFNKTKTIIGEVLYPVDNSYQYNLKTGKCEYLAGTAWENAKPVTVVSEPYKLFIMNIFNNKMDEHEFVTVLHDGNLHITLNSFQSKDYSDLFFNKLR